MTSPKIALKNIYIDEIFFFKVKRNVCKEFPFHIPHYKTILKKIHYHNNRFDKYFNKKNINVINLFNGIKYFIYLILR